MWSWYRWDENTHTYRDSTQIDFIITDNKRLLKDVKAVPSVSLDSDHRLVIAKIRAEKLNSAPRKTRKRFVVENLKKRRKGHRI